VLSEEKSKAEWERRVKDSPEASSVYGYSLSDADAAPQPGDDAAVAAELAGEASGGGPPDADEPRGPELSRSAAEEARGDPSALGEEISVAERKDALGPRLRLMWLNGAKRQGVAEAAERVRRRNKHTFPPRNVNGEAERRPRRAFRPPRHADGKNSPISPRPRQRAKTPQTRSPANLRGRFKPRTPVRRADAAEDGKH
jgi:hypothetical protein